MSLINRCGMITFPLQPVFDWQNKIFPDDPISIDGDPFGHENGTIYLIPEMETFEQFEKWIQKNYKVFFEELLFGWCTDESLWPAKRNHKMFREWFHVSFQPMVFDTLNISLKHDED